MSHLKKFIGLTTFTVFLAMIFFIHLFIAHYREILHTNPHVDIWSVLKPTMETPFILHDMESLILISIGLLITLFSIIKGMNLDDEYPGYGRVYRRWKASDNEFLKSKKQARKLMRELYVVTLKKSDSMMETLEKSKAKLEALDSDLDAFINTYKGYHLKAVQTARELLSDYRSGVQFIYGDRRSFTYNDRLLVGEGGLSRLNINMLLDSKILLEKELNTINQHINNFYSNQQRFEERLEQLKDNYLDDAQIEKMLQQIKKNRELEL